MNQNNNYSKEQVSKMRQDAINRANHMYKKRTNQYNDYTKKNDNDSNNIINDNFKSNNNNHKTNVRQQNVSIDSLLNNLGIDKEQALIIILIVLLLKEKSDYKLILALIYLLT